MDWGYIEHVQHEMGRATEAELDRYDTYLHATNNGGLTDRAWLLSDRDCYYRNPYYSGFPVNHPYDVDEDSGYFVEGYQLELYFGPDPLGPDEVPF
jgi:hypothetical protein